MRTLATLLFLLIVKAGIAQNLTGQITDEKHVPVAFASIGIVGTNLATVSNENGEFVIKVDKLPAQIRISHVSYNGAEFTIQNLEKLSITLKAASISLNTVTVDPYAGQRIVEKALKNAEAHAQVDQYGHAFYRQLTTTDQQPSQIYELFYEVKLNPKRVTGWIAKQSRFAQLNQDLTFAMNNQSYLTFSYGGYLFPLEKGVFVNLRSLKDYHMEVEKFIDQPNQQIAVVNCRYTGKKKKAYYVNSRFYIGMEDNQIYRMENSVFNLPVKFDHASSAFPVIFTSIASFTPSPTGASVLENISTRLFLKPNFNSRLLNVTVTSMLSVYQLDQTLSNQTFNMVSRDTKDKNVVESISYNPDFWRNNPIVKQTALENSFTQMMESKSAFGTMIHQP